jgi:hypothetical protein
MPSPLTKRCSPSPLLTSNPCLNKKRIFENIIKTKLRKKSQVLGELSVKNTMPTYINTGESSASHPLTSWKARDLNSFGFSDPITHCLCFETPMNSSVLFTNCHILKKINSRKLHSWNFKA